jgi:hypothetical protein
MTCRPVDQGHLAEGRRSVGTHRRQALGKAHHGRLRSARGTVAQVHQVLAGHILDDREVGRLGRHPLIVVGYIPFEAEAANLFFQLVSDRYGCASVIVTSNKPFGRRG